MESEMKTWTILGERFFFVRLRFPRDFNGDKFILFTGRQMADEDCNMYSEPVPAGQRWRVHAISFLPDSPIAFAPFIKLCTDFPNAKLTLKVPNLEGCGEIPLSNFWQEGEYILHPKYNLPTHWQLNEMTLFKVFLEFPKKDIEENRLKERMQEIFSEIPRGAFRFILHAEVMGAY